MSELVIGISNVVSPLCYSVIRLEPFSRCSLACTYCFARWYWGESGIRPKPESVRAFESLARAVSRAGAKALPARLATLSEPFQEAEARCKISLRFLEVCLKYGYPVIINTKSTLYLKDPWRRVIEELCEVGLAVIQVSIPSLNESLAKHLEPRAPPVKERLRALSELSTACPALVVRLSPYVPGLSTYPSVAEVAATLKDVGARHVIAESLRIEAEEAENYLKLFREFKVGLSKDDLEPYSLATDSLLRFSLALRLREYVELAEALRKEGITFATCKEGLFSIHTAPNCCGMHLMRSDVVGLRPTLKEVYEYVRTCGGLRIEDVEEVFYSVICRSSSNLLCRDDFSPYPKGVRKALKYHEKKLLKVLKDPQILGKISPCLAIQESYILPKEVRLH